MSGYRYPMPAALQHMVLEGHHVVEASAGTGKTFLIEHRVLDLVLRGVELEHILVVTFTEKATAELRTRVRALLARARDTAEHRCDPDDPHVLIDETGRRRLSSALLSFDRASISTIHGYCQRILSENAFANRRLFEQSQVASETAFAAAFKAVLREELARDPAHASYLAAWLAREKTVSDLHQLLYECTRQRARLTPRFDSELLARALVAASSELPDLVTEELGHQLERARIGRTNTIKKVLANLELLVELLAEHGDPARFLAELERRDPKLLDYLAGKLEPSGICDANVVVLATHVQSLAAAAVPLAAAVAARFAPLVAARVRRDKARRGSFDFQDMLELVRDGLAGPGGAALATTLRRRYPHALIDEFQDTDELQWEIFRRIYLEREGGHLDVIGDPKQAIYSFRGADILTYLEARAEIERRGGRVIALQDNFRSTADMVEAYNLIFEERFGTTYFSGGITYDAPARAAGSHRATCGGEPIVPIVIARPRAQQKLSSDAVRAAMAGFITGEIERLLGDDGAAIELWDGDEPRRLKASDIFVLTRSVRESDQVATALRRAGIRCALYKQEGLFQSAEAREVLDLLCGIAEPRRQSARFRAWQTRFFGVCLADLPHLADVPETHPLLARLYEWRAFADRLDYERLFSAVVDSSGIVERELLLEPSERALTNFLHLFELLLEEVMRSRCELHELIAQLKHWIDDITDLGTDDRNVQRLESDRDAVQIMTIHKAKGLEAAVVFVTGGYGAGRSGDVNLYHAPDGERRVHVGRLDAAARAAVEAEAAAEDERLLYVALTRAVARLYVPFIEPGRLKASRLGSYQAVNRRLEPIAAQLQRSADLRRLFELRDVNAGLPESSGRARPADPAVLSSWQLPGALLEPDRADPELEQIRRRRSGLAITSYTQMKQRRRSASPIEAVDFKVDNDDITARLPEHHLPGGAAAGIFLHEILEHADYQAVADADSFDGWRQRPEVDQLFREAMLRHDQDARYLHHAQELVFTSLRASFTVAGAEIAGVAGCERHLHEVEFLYPVGGATFIKGFIDLIFEHRGRVYLLDWKSDVLADYSAGAIAAHIDTHYELQANLYSLALARMLGISSSAQLAERVGGMIYMFLRGTGEDVAGSGVAARRPTWDELRAVEAELERTAAP